MTLSLSHGGGETIYTSDVLSDRVLIGTIDGVRVIERTAAGWAATGHALQGNHVHALVFEERSGTWFAGIRKGGVFASTDGGATWDARDNGLTVRNVYSLSKNVVDGKVRLFLGTEPSALFISDDLGETWAELPGFKDVPSAESWTFPGPPHESHLKHIAFAPNDPNTIWGSIEQGALLKSTDGGQSWRDFTNLYVDVHRCIVHPDHPSRLYVTGGQGLWISDDAGESWANPFNRGSEEGGYPDQLVYKPSDPSYMIVSAGRKSPPAWKEETAGSRISRSRDGGFTWEIMTGGLPDRMPHSVEAMCLEEVGGQTQLFAATTGGSVLHSTDAGETWETIVTGLAPVSKGGHYENLVGQPA